MEQLSVGPRLDAEQIGRQAADIAVAPAAIIHIVPAIVVMEDKLVDGLCAVHDIVDERPAQRIPIGPFGPVGHSHTDAAHLAFVYIVATEE